MEVSFSYLEIVHQKFVFIPEDTTVYKERYKVVLIHLQCKRQFA